MFDLHILLIILALAPSRVYSAYIPSPYPSATATPSATIPSIPHPTLAPRCGPQGGNCDFGSNAAPLQASVVTSTVMSVTSVPCYITTYVTDSTTVTDTIYSTETITETQTKEGIVYIIQYEPKPILRTTNIKSVIQVTIDVQSAWIESGTETPPASTMKTEWKSMGGGSGECETCGKGGSQPQQGQGQGQPQGQPKGGPAWTHVSAGTSGNPQGDSGNDGWAGAAGAGQVGVGSGGTTWGNGNGQGTWESAASPSKNANPRLGFMCLGLAVGVIFLGEIVHQLR